MDKNTLNKAIIMVTTTQFKKDAKAYHVIVEEAGYTIAKNDGCFKVRSKETNKVVWVTEDWDWHGKHYYIIHTGYGSVRKFYNSNIPFDFQSYLDTPVNPYAKELYPRSKAYQKYAKLHSAKWDIKFYHEKIQETQAKITLLHKQVEALQKDIIRYTKMQVEAEQRIKEVRQELGLTEV